MNALAHELAKSPSDSVARHGAADRAADREPDLRGSRCIRAQSQVRDQRARSGPLSGAERDAEITAAAKTVLRRQHERSGRQTPATLVTAGRQNRAAGAGAHAQPKPMPARATSVVRLESSLAHASSAALNDLVCETKTSLRYGRQDRCQRATRRLAEK